MVRNTLNTVTQYTHMFTWHWTKVLMKYVVSYSISFLKTSSYCNLLLGLHLQFEKYWSRCEVGNEHLGTKSFWQTVGYNEVGQKSNEYVLRIPHANPSGNLTILHACLQVSSQKCIPPGRSFQISLIQCQAPQALLNVPHSWCVCRQRSTYRRAHQNQPGVLTNDAA